MKPDAKPDELELPAPVEKRFHDLRGELDAAEKRMKQQDEAMAVLRKQALATRSDRQILESIEQSLAALLRLFASGKK